MRSAILIVVSLMAATNLCRADIDTSPLPVNIVPAFPELAWPAWLTGEDEGRTKKLLPVMLGGAGDGTDRMFVALQYGYVLGFENSSAATDVQLLLDISEQVHYDPNQNEEGLLGLAFHPQFADNGQLFVYYTPEGGPRRSVISRFRVSTEDTNKVDPASEEILLTISQPYWNHNGGTIVFGPDGYLYVGLGDGGKFNDPHGNGQNLQTLLGSILRIDVDRKTELPDGSSQPYSIPSDNPFVNSPNGARPEIWAYGLRNVWRMSFDRKTDTFWAADVGQDTWEEIDIIRPGGNYGWNLREGAHPFGSNGVERREDLVEPIWEYGREFGKSITGGSVYRGSQVPELAGAYVYADYVSGHLWALWYDQQSSEVTANRTLRTHGAPVMTFGEDDRGEIYFSSPQGAILKFASP